MYADRISAGTKRSARDRLQSDYAPSSSHLPSKRQRHGDDKWKHDLYEEKRPQLSIGPRDLRFKLQKKVLQQTPQIGNSVQGIRDLREKLSGTIHSQPVKADPPKVKVVVEPSKHAKKSSVDVPAKTHKPAIPSLPKKAHSKADQSAVDGFLQSLGLEKYLITFQAEEIDMTALMHMTDGDLKALGVPMGPRKKILLALNARS